jgi:hypothetical protein
LQVEDESSTANKAVDPATGAIKENLQNKKDR